MRRLRRTKIVATLGPASGNRDMIPKLFEAGADVFRINMSHSSHDRMRELVSLIRAAEQDYNRPIGILADLQGPKLRVGAFANTSVMLDNGAIFTFDTDTRAGDTNRVHLPHPEIFAGSPGVFGAPDASVPFGRIVNNTIWGGGSNGTGIEVRDNAAPTILNNLFSNLEAISMKDIEGTGGADQVTLNATDVIDFGAGTFDAALDAFGAKDAIKVDGENGDVLNLTGGNWSKSGVDPNTPPGYDLYVHTTAGTTDAFVLVQTAITVNMS